MSTRDVTVAGTSSVADSRSVGSPTGAATNEVRLLITGMTCASCSARIERKLAKLDGVQSATVNLATEKAQVSFASPTTPQQIIAEVEKTGYGASLVGQAPSRQASADEPATASAAGTRPDGPASEPQRQQDDEAPHQHGEAPSGIRLRLVGALALTIPVFLLAMVIPRFGASGWLELALATPVVVVRVALPPRRRHQRATPRLDDGHPRLDRGARCVGFLGRRLVHRR